MDEFLEQSWYFGADVVDAPAAELLQGLLGFAYSVQHLLRVELVLEQQTGSAAYTALACTDALVLLVQYQSVRHFGHGSVVVTRERPEHVKFSAGTLRQYAVLYLLSALVCTLHQRH